MPASMFCRDSVFPPLIPMLWDWAHHAASHLCLVRDIWHEVVLGAVDELEGGGLHMRGEGWIFEFKVELWPAGMSGGQHTPGG